MSSDSDLSSSQDGQNQQTRLQSIWKSIKQTKNLSHLQRESRIDYEDSSLNHRLKHSFNRADYKYEENRQDQLKQNLAHLLKKFQQSQKQIDFLKNEIENVKRLARQDADGQKRQYQTKLKKQMKKLITVQKQNIDDNKEQKYKIQQLQKQIERLNLKIKSLQYQKKNSDLEMLKLKQINQAYLAQKNQENQAQQWLHQNVKGQQLLELTEAQSTIDRLVQLIKKTDQFREIAPILEDAKGLHYLKNIVKRLKSGQLILPQNSNKKTCSCSNSKVNEKLLWSPVECYKILLNLKLKYDYLSEDCIEEVLFEMNRIYDSREQRRVNKLRQNYENDAKLLKKRCEQSYDELLAKKQINRLKKQLKNAKSNIKSKPVNRLGELRTKGQIQDELKLKIRQIKLLHERIRLLQTQNGFNDKGLYWQGALWMIDKVLYDVQSNQGQIKQFQITFRDRLDSNYQPQDWLRSYKEFFQRLTQLNSSLVEKLLVIKQSALKKMGQ